MSPSEDALRRDRATRLVNAPRIVGEQWEREAADKAIAVARKAGIALPQRIPVFFHLPKEDYPRGATDGVEVHLALPVLSDRADLMHTVWHELGHVADAFAQTPWDRATAEERADRFALEMMAFMKSGVSPKAVAPTVPEQTKEPATIQSVDVDVDVDAQEAASEARATPTTCPRPTSISDNSRAFLVDEVERRFKRLGRMLEGEEAGRLLRVLERLVLSEFARKA